MCVLVAVVCVCVSVRLVALTVTVVSVTLCVTVVSVTVTVLFVVVVVVTQQGSAQIVLQLPTEATPEQVKSAFARDSQVTPGRHSCVQVLLGQSSGDSVAL